MKKMFLVLTLVLAGSLAANAKVVSVDFDGYCDGIEAVRYSPSPGVIPVVFLAGIHDVLNSCGFGFNTNVGGFKHGNNLNIAPFAAPVDDFSDPIEGLYGFNYSLQYLVHEKTATVGCVWANYFSNGNANYLFINGTCTQPTQAQKRGPRSGSPTTKR